MSKTLARRFFSLLLSLLLLLSVLPFSAPAAGADVSIGSVEELLSFAKNCSLDAWSAGKRVRLTADLDLTGVDFASIPIFSGSFDGCGHTIRGLELTGPGSVQGFFRYLEEGSSLRSLHLEGRVEPSGSRVSVGGIVGSCGGTVTDCSFSGVVSGDSDVGGLVGRALRSACLEDCVFSGSVSGQKNCGGIAGVSRGTIRSCRNDGAVNTAPSEGTSLNELADEGLDEALTLFNGTAQTLNPSLAGIRSDAGGIAGYSGGTILNCVNTAQVGYPHTGYNVGGIAGRQAGSIRGCVNSGPVYGRKDVGGIAGQAEPALLIILQEEDSPSLRDELQELSALIDRAAGNAGSGSAAVSAAIAALQGEADSARESGGELLRQGADFVNENLTVLSGLEGMLSDGAGSLATAFEGLETTAEAFAQAAAELKDGGGLLASLAGAKLFSPEEGEAFSGAFQEAGSLLNTALVRARAAWKDLRASLAARDEGAYGTALSDLADAAADAATAQLRLRELLSELKTLLLHWEGFAPVREDLENVLTQLQALHDAAVRFREATLRLRSQLRFDPEQFRQGAAEFSGALDALSSAGAEARRSLATLAETAAGLDLSPELRPVGDALSRFGGALAGAFGGLEPVFSAAAEAADALKDPPAFSSLSDEARDETDRLLAALGGISAGLQALNGSAAGLGGTLAADLRAVNSQLEQVFTLLLDSVEQLRSQPEELSLSDLIEDTSDEDVLHTREGKISFCRNEGPVEGDRSVGGAVGSMAIELDLDPEDDSPIELKLNASYQTKSVLYACVNQGPVTGKKDCVGGLCGRMELGTLLNCESYGPVESSDGSYVGGVAGLSEGRVRSCYAKCSVAGLDYVGGIAGSGTVLRSCVALVRLDRGQEYLGAIAGFAERKDGGVTDNVYLDLGLAGIDSVSYAGAAEGLTYDELARRTDLPAGFLRFRLTLRAEGETVAVLPFRYGEDLSLLTLPELPEKDGFYGRWPELTAADAVSDLTVDALYERQITLLPSRELVDGFPLAYADGSFTDKAVLSLTEPDVVPPAPAEGAKAWWVYDYSLAGEEISLPLSLRLRCGDQTARLYRVSETVRAQQTWEELPLTFKGCYALFTVPENSGRLLLLVPKAKVPLPLLAGGAGLLLLGGVLLGLLLRRRKKARAKVTEN